MLDFRLFSTDIRFKGLDNLEKQKIELNAKLKVLAKKEQLLV
jgi:hypothetical protein